MPKNDSAGNPWENYLGNIDAGYERRPDLFISTDPIKTLKLGSSETGKCVVAGAKGTGKTAICEFLASTAEKNKRFVWRVDTVRRFMNVHVSELGEYPAEIESILLNVVLAQLINIVKENREQFPEKAKEALIKLDETFIPKLKGHFMQFLQGTTAEVGPVTWDFDKILKSKSKTQFTEFTITDYVEALGPCFEELPALILFDDIDDVFLGADMPSYPAFVEGLIRAARTVNAEFGSRIHFLVFLKYGIYRSFYDKPRDYDKVKDYILILRWDEGDLERVLSRRIADKVGISKDEKPWKTWAKVFAPSNKASITEIQRYLYDRCSSGPRDLIDFSNRAIEASGGLNISIGDLRQCEAGFSEAKIIGIHQDYGYTYPDVQTLIKQCFSRRKDFTPKSKYDSEDFEDLVFNIKVDDGIKTDFNEYDYFRMADPLDLIRLFYTVGFIGYVNPAGSPPRFVLDDPAASNLGDSEQYVIHKAFWKALGIAK